VRKSRREREKEAAEAKRKEEEEDNARAYAEFIQTFEGDDTGRRFAIGFVKASADTSIPYAPSYKSQRDGSSKDSSHDKMVCLNPLLTNYG
jgi:U2-associated protein SR140